MTQPKKRIVRKPVPPIAEGARLISIRQAMEYCCIGRSKLYEIGQANPGLFKKIGSKTLVDLHMFDSILNALPVVHSE